MHRLVLLLLLSFSGCASLSGILDSLPEPKLELVGIKFQSWNLDRFSVKALAVLKNPYPTSLPKSQLQLQVSLAGKKFTQIQSDVDKIEANGSQEIPLVFQFTYKDLITLLGQKTLFSQDSIELRLSGLVATPLPTQLQGKIPGKERFELPWEETFLLPSFQPKIEIQNFKVVLPDTGSILQSAASAVGDWVSGGSRATSPSPSPSLLSTEFDLALTNSFGSAFQWDGLQFDLTMGTEPFMSASPKNIQNLGKSSIARVQTSLPLSGVSQALQNLLLKRESPYSIKGKSDVLFSQIPAGILPALEFETKGNLKW